MLRKRYIIALIVFLTACEEIERHVILRQIDFEVDPQANKGEAFVCHLVVPYSIDLDQRLRGMDAQTYFTQLTDLQKTYKDTLEIFRYDLIPGKNKLNQKVEPRSRFRAKGAYVFAKYSSPGRFAERIGLYNKILVQFSSHKMELQNDFNLKKWTKSIEQKK